jgi:hypothetical protein
LPNGQSRSLTSKNDGHSPDNGELVQQYKVEKCDKCAKIEKLDKFGYQKSDPARISFGFVVNADDHTLG